MQQQKTRRPNKQRSEETRAALTTAARALFVEKGYAETATPEIVAAAGVTRGALYHHFTDKADLFRTIVLQEATAIASEIEQASTAVADPRDGLAIGSAAYFAAMAAPGRARLLLLEGPAVLGPDGMAEIDRMTGGAELREGLAAALADRRPADPTLDALTDITSAAFDRAALAIANGADTAAYQAAVDLLLAGLSSAE